VKRFLFIYPGALGDLLLAAPVFQALREQNADAAIECVGSVPQIRLLPLLGLIDRVYSIDDRRFLPLFGGKNCPERLLSFFRSFDAVVFWVSNLNVNCSDIPLKVLDPRPDPHPPVHHAQYLYQTVQSFLNLPARNVTSFYLKNEPDNRPNYRPVLLVHPGSGSPAKNAPIDRFLVSAQKWKQKTGGEVLFLFGPADADVRQEFKKMAPPSEFSICDSPGFDDLIKRMASADFYLGNDSGVSHLAGVLNKRGLVFFRTTDPTIWRPLGTRLRSVIV